jgi:hypothetical protein
MKKAQVLINKLAGERCTRALVLALKKILHARGWGLQCLKSGCGQSATIGWKRCKPCQEGGYMHILHTDKEGNWLTHIDKSVNL